MRILLAEDDQLLAEGIEAGLTQDGYAVDWVRDGSEAEHALAMESFDLLILDLGLPRRDGLEVLRSLREAGKTLPVLILTARDGVPERIEGLDAGADDYLCKPCDLDELGARVRALIRRGKGQAGPLLSCAELTLDPATRRVENGGMPVTLSRREFALLEALLSNRDRTVTRQRLLQSLYAWSDEVESNTLAVHIHNLRRKLGGGLIHTVRGVGYRLSAEDE